MELWNSGDLCNYVGAVESIGAARESVEQLQTTTLRGEPLNCSLGFFFDVALSSQPGR